MRQQPDDEFKDLPISNQAKWARRNREKVNATRRKYYASNEEARKRRNEYAREYRNRIKVDKP